MIIFRADGNPQIGMGHIMRCLSIADAAKGIGEESLFVLSSDECRGIISSRGHEANVLNSDYSKMEPGDILPALNAYSPSAVFVDSYYVTPEYMEMVADECRCKNCNLIYVDDRCSFPYRCDALLNYNIFANRENYLELYSKSISPMFMLGASFAPLRKEFQRTAKRNFTDEAVDIFVSTGGADTELLTKDLVGEAISCPGHVFHFVVGMMNPDRESIRSMSEGHRNIVIHENVTRMDELMRSCAVAISAAGSTLYELCATGTPTITYIIADNQIPAAKEFDAMGIMKNCGDIREMGRKSLAKKLIQEVVKLAGDYGERRRISNLVGTVVDGKGADRIMEKLKTLH